MKLQTCAMLVVLAAAAPAAAQSPTHAYRLLVTTGSAEGVSEKEAADLLEESAYIAQDFGAFDVLRPYQLDGILGGENAGTVLGCGAAADCYVMALDQTSFDYTLLLDVQAGNAGVVVRYRMVDLKTGVVARQSQALPGVGAFDGLAAPCQDALKAIPDWVEPLAASAPVVAAPAPVGVLAPSPGPRNATPPRSTQWKTAMWLSGGGAAAAAGGLLLGFAADDTLQEIQAKPHTTDKVESLQEMGESQQTAANVLMGLGAASAVAGLALWLLDDGPTGEARVWVDPGQRSAGVWLAW